MPNEIAEYLPPVVILIVLFRRTKKPRQIRPKLMWIFPAILGVLGAVFVAGAINQGAALTMLEAAVVIGAAVVGGALGAFRAHALHLTKHPDSGVIEATLSMWGLIVILVWMVGRNVLRHSDLHNAMAPFGVFNAAMIALALASVIARAVVLSQRCAALEQMPAKTPAGNLV